MKVQRFNKRVSFSIKILRVFKKLVFCVNRQKMRVKVATTVVKVELLFLVLRN